MNLKYFIIGMIFISIIIPIIESIGELIILFFEMLKAKISLVLAKTNSEIKKCAIGENESRRVIGFVAPNSDAFGEEEESEDEE